MRYPHGAKRSRLGGGRDGGTGLTGTMALLELGPAAPLGAAWRRSISGGPAFDGRGPLSCESSAGDCGSEALTCSRAFCAVASGPLGIITEDPMAAAL